MVGIETIGRVVLVAKRGEAISEQGLNSALSALNNPSKFEQDQFDD